MAPDGAAVRAYLVALQERITRALETLDGVGHFARDCWSRPGGGGGESRVLKNGAVLEQGGVG